MDSPFLSDNAKTNIGKLDVRYHKSINGILKECFGQTREYDSAKIHFGKFDLVSYLNITPHQIVLDGEECRIGHICSVATIALFRGQGYATALLEEALEWMQEEGFIAASLEAENPTVYEKVGFCQAPEPNEDIMALLLVDWDVDVFSDKNMEAWSVLRNAAK